MWFTASQFFFIGLTVGVVAGIAVAMLLRPYDFKEPDTEQDDSVN